MNDKEAMNVASQCRATASADLCKNILVDGGSGFLFELLLDAAKAIETLAQPEQEPVGQLLEDAFGRGQVMWFNKPKDESMLYTTPPQRTEEKK